MTSDLDSISCERLVDDNELLEYLRQPAVEVCETMRRGGWQVQLRINVDDSESFAAWLDRGSDVIRLPVPGNNLEQTRRLAAYAIHWFTQRHSDAAREQIELAAGRLSGWATGRALVSFFSIRSREAYRREAIGIAVATAALRDPRAPSSASERAVMATTLAEAVYFTEYDW